MSKMMTYALKGGILTHISDVESGLKCGCICPQCSNVLVAHKGNKIAHHFKHYNAEECEGGYQTSLHLLAKKILSEENRFVIPPVAYTFNPNVKFINNPATEIKIDSVEVETKTGDIIPDIVLHCGNQVLLVEIYVTHKVDDDKIKKIKSLGISAIEIDLSGVDRAVSETELREILLNDSSEKAWVFNRYIEYWKSQLFNIVEKYRVTMLSFGDRLIAEQVKDCPLETGNEVFIPRAYYIGCIDCQYYAYMEQNRYYEAQFIYCFGKNKIETLSDLKRVLGRDK